MSQSENVDQGPTLLAEGKKLRQEGRLDDAIETLARAVECQMSEGEEISPELAEYLIEYADALLCKEEANSSDVFASAGAGQQDSDDEEGTIPRLDSGRVGQPPAPAEADEDEILSDIQLAWESFEHARLCLHTREDSLERSKDLSFVHCRLADIQSLQDQFSASTADYGESIEFALKADLPVRKVAGLLVSLGQTVQVLMTSDEIKSASFDESQFIAKFKSVFASVKEKFACSTELSTENSVALVARDAFLLAHTLLKTVDSSELKATIDEIKACADDCVQQQAEVDQAKSIVPGVTSSGFAKPSGNEASSNVVTVTVKRKTAGEEGESEESKKMKSDASIRADRAKLVD